MSPRRTILIGLLLPLLAAGCHVRPLWLMSKQTDLPPAAFANKPTLDDIVYVVNANTQRVQRLQTENATLRVEGVPALRANLAYEQPRNFRLLAQLSQFTGRELDMGSNEELFWFWIRRDSQPSVYFARHATFADSPARDLIPIEPNRLIDTLGLVYLDPAGQHRGPVERDAGLLEVTSQLPSPRGNLTRVLLVDAKYGWPAATALVRCQRSVADVGPCESAAVLPRRGGHDATSSRGDADAGPAGPDRFRRGCGQLFDQPTIGGFG